MEMPSVASAGGSATVAGVGLFFNGTGGVAREPMEASLSRARYGSPHQHPYRFGVGVVAPRLTEVGAASKRRHLAQRFAVWVHDHRCSSSMTAGNKRLFSLWTWRWVSVSRSARPSNSAR